MKLANVEKLIQDINESWLLALRSVGISEAILEDVESTVNDAIANNAMLECEEDEKD